MPSFRTRFGAALALSAAAFSAACAPAADESEAFEEPESDLAARESGFGSDPDYVVRQRVLFEQETGAIVRFERQPFSHRARRWHVYPMTIYPGARVAFRLMSDDRQMSQIAEVRLYGPAFSDGSFPKARTVRTNEHGQAEIAEGALEPGRYVVVVGPREKDAFLRRYPGNVVALKLAGQEDPTDFGISLTADGYIAESLGAQGEAVRYRVVSPTPDDAHEPATKGMRLRPLAGGGRDLEATIVDWSNRELYTAASGSADSGTLGVLEGDSFVLEPGRSERHMVVVDAARVGKSDPFLIQVLPETLPSTTEVPAALRGKTIKIGRVPDCESTSCRVPVVDDPEAKTCAVATAATCGEGKNCFGGKCLAELPAAVVSSLADAYKPLFVDPQEPSTYSLEIACKENCMPTPVDRSRMTKYPVYFAHGFNSSGDAWKGILTFLAQVAGFRDRSRAEDVPAFEPTEIRADRLRQQLTTYIQYLEEAAPIPGERMRVNVIAHSMGGLDSRTLVSSPKFNEECERSECVDVTDDGKETTPTHCCAPSENGKPTMWRDRVASVTTLSTPHRGSSFASWAISQMRDGAIASPALRTVAQRFFGFDEAGYDGFRRTLDALSVERGEEREKSLSPPNPARVYTWACATGQERCSAPAGSELPTKGANGYQLPPPAARPTIFSWAAMACATGGCGNVLDPALLLPYGVMYTSGEKKNDGVVGVERARFGIFMGVVPADHFDWTRTSDTVGGGKRALEWLFGVKTEPIERFHQVWLERLAQAGY